MAESERPRIGDGLTATISAHGAELHAIRTAGSQPARAALLADSAINRI